jgi:DNA-directed RNA polymerase specialized sigma24 family protein
VTNKKVKQATAVVDSYASMSEFCNYFVREMDSLYQLAFLLAGSSRLAEESIVAALEDCKRAKVFKPWLESWGRLAVIERTLKATADGSGVDANILDDAPMERRAILQLNRFERVVYTLSVLEKYSVRDCAILLRVSKQEISAAKVRALKEVSTFLASIFMTQENAVALGA